MIRILDKDDFDAVADLIVSRQQFLGVAQEHLEMHRKFSAANAKDLLRAGPAIGNIIASEEDGILTGALFTLVSLQQPCYYVNKAYTRPGAELSTLANLFDATIQHYEELGYNRFYTMYKKANVAAYHRLWKTTAILKNYIRYTELELDVHERPKFADYWELLCGRQLYMDPMVIRAFIRKTDDMI